MTLSSLHRITAVTGQNGILSNYSVSFLFMGTYPDIRLIYTSIGTAGRFCRETRGFIVFLLNIQVVICKML